MNAARWVPNSAGKRRGGMYGYSVCDFRCGSSSFSRISQATRPRAVQ
jgi:Leu/Phe-tRNA-protein transferase